MFEATHSDLLLAGGIVYAVPCSGFKVASAAEGSQTRGLGEGSHVAGASEGARVASAEEGSRVNAANEASQAAAANEASKLGAHSEESNRAGASTIASCQRLGGGAYRLVSRVDPATLSVFDGAVFFHVTADGRLQ